MLAGYPTRRFGTGVHSFPGGKSYRLSVIGYRLIVVGQVRQVGQVGQEGEKGRKGEGEKG
jgi:hypothetical protein